MQTNGDLVSRRRTGTVDLPHKPEAGLAEWTSRIKELQRQVDADEEAETKRLEEEIAASRLARMRRSTGRGTSVDLSTTEIAKSLRESSNTPAPPADREQVQSEALKKLSGDSRSPGLSPHARDNGPSSKPSTSPQPMSLAAFMGGKATGVRLNKHAPQQDSHDPTQFESRTITAPHPIFGKGGVAMPGMAGRSRVADRNEESPPAKPTVAVPTSQDRQPASAHESSSAMRTLVHNAEERRKSAARKPTSIASTDATNTRQRTFSSPGSASLSPSSASSWKRETLRDHSSPSPSTRPTTPGSQSAAYNPPRSGRHTPTRSTTPSQPSRRESVSPLPQPRTQQTASYAPAPPSPSTVSAPGLAKPIQAAPRKSYQGPDLPLAHSPSATYLRTPATKEPTPSLSRLQGRGFVQSMVKASSQIDSPPSHSSGSPSASPAEKSRETARKSSVLDRWQFGNDSSPPIIAPKPMPLRKSKTVESTSHPASPSSPTFTPPPPKVIRPDYTGKSLKSVASLPSIAQTAAAQVSTRNGSAKTEVGSGRSSPGQKRGLGSSTTMISYIKPLKTGDNPPTNAPPSRPSSAAASRSRAASPEVDEMGLRVRSRSRSRSVVGSEVTQKRQAEANTGKPLSHPTKERARKPRKAKTAVSLKPEGEDAASQKPEAVSRAVDEATLASFDVKNLAAKGPSPLEADVVSAIPSHVEDDVSVSGPGRRVHFPLDVPSAPPPRAEKPHSPIRHTRIPSTGNRATVMEVAQALHAHDGHVTKSPQEESPVVPEAAASSMSVGSDIGAARPAVKAVVAKWGPQAQPKAAEEIVVPTPPPMERRKSGHEKYSAFTLPPLLEEKTPVHSPAGTLTREAARSVATENLDPPHDDQAASQKVESQNISPPGVSPVPQAVGSVRATSVAEDKFVHFQHNDGPLPRVDVAAAFHSTSKPFNPDADDQTISVEVMSIQGTTATAITHDPHIFYDAEVLAVIHRFKSKSKGLVGTQVWAWRGSKCHVGEREEKKLQEMARRYNTTLMTAYEYSEPPEMVHVLGGRLITRQGLRTHWSAENTAMHLVRLMNGVLFIDELELGIKNLCSGYSYCLSLLETFYVWHGYASISEERKAALQYAQSLASSPESIIELVEGESDQDEMFWLILGEGDYAKADYWRWKSNAPSFNPRAWRVHADGGTRSSLIPSSLGGVLDLHSEVYILDCIWEIFVLVGSDARGHREDIRLALSVADELSAIAAPSRPFTPPVHVLVLPSQIPIDLRLMFRDLNESELNKNSTPDHMNLLPSTLALEHLQKTSWNKDALKDSDMLPLGLQSVS